MFLFDFEIFIDYLRNNPDKQPIVESYERFYGKISPNLSDNVFYREYISKFAIPDIMISKLMVPEKLRFAIDYNLLLQLICSSLHVNYKIIRTSKGILMEILLIINNIRKEKILSELSILKILQFHEFYLLEQIILFNLMTRDNRVKDATLARQSLKLKQFQHAIIGLDEFYDNDDSILTDLL